MSTGSIWGTGSTESPEPVANPHVLWKNMLAVSIAALVILLLFFLDGILVILTGVFTFADAWNSGIYKKPDSRSFLNLSPGAWGVAMMGLLIVAYPCYLFSRNRLKTKEGPVVNWVLAIVFGGITLVWTGLQLVIPIAEAA